MASPDPARNGCPPPGYYGRFGSSDVDHDRIDDMVDACPRLAGEPSADPERHGCPPAGDQDGDGVTDEVDACLTAAGPRSASPTRNGCPLARAEGDRVVLLDGISFETGSVQIHRESAPGLDAVGALLRARADIARVRVAGHTDDQGSRALNQRLSAGRASAVVRALTARGVAPDRLTAEGFGPDHPIASNDTEEGRAANRRVELEIVARAAGSSRADTLPLTPTSPEGSGLDVPVSVSGSRPQLVPMTDPGFDDPRKTPPTPMVPVDDPGFPKERAAPPSDAGDPPAARPK